MYFGMARRRHDATLAGYTRLLHNGLATLAKLEDVARDTDRLAGFDAVFVSGGHAPLVGLLHRDAFADDSLNDDFGALLRYFHDQQRATALICHAPAALAAAPHVDDRWIYDGYRMTCCKTVMDTLLCSVPLVRRFRGHLQEDHRPRPPTRPRRPAPRSSPRKGPKYMTDALVIDPAGLQRLSCNAKADPATGNRILKATTVCEAGFRNMTYVRDLTPLLAGEPSALLGDDAGGRPVGNRPDRVGFLQLGRDARQRDRLVARVWRRPSGLACGRQGLSWAKIAESIGQGSGMDSRGAARPAPARGRRCGNGRIAPRPRRRGGGGASDDPIPVPGRRRGERSRRFTGSTRRWPSTAPRSRPPGATEWSSSSTASSSTIHGNTPRRLRRYLHDDDGSRGQLIGPRSLPRHPGVCRGAGSAWLIRNPRRRAATCRSTTPAPAPS